MGLPAFLVALGFFLYTKKLTRKKIHTSAFYILVTFPILAYLCPTLQSHTTENQNNIILDTLKFIFFGKGNKIEEYTRNGVHYPAFTFYSGQVFLTYIEAWLSVLFYSVFCTLFSDKEPYN